MNEADRGEGAGELLFAGRFARDAVRATLLATPRPTTPDLEALIERRWQAAVERAARDGRELFDGALLRLAELPIVHSASSSVELKVARSSYREFVGTNLARAESTTEPTAGESTVGTVARSTAARASRPADRGGRYSWQCFGNAIGTSALLLTADGIVVAGRRSERVFGLPGWLHCFGGMLEAVDSHADCPTVDVFASMERELVEEIGLAPSDLSELVLLGALREPRCDQPELLFGATTRLTRAMLSTRFVGAPSRSEHSALVDLPRAAAARTMALDRLDRVSPVTYACSRLLGDR
ncbi:MAG: NUDIX hydrolase [Planctomycetes bacterium]|nr:NUDIX hydrolase [Planctomycetota bacterium]